MEQHEDRRSGQTEAHVRTFLLTLITAGIIALVTVTIQTRESLARLDERLNGFSQQLATIVVGLRDAESRIDHEADMSRVNGRVDGVEHRVDRLESKK